MDIERADRKSSQCGECQGTGVEEEEGGGGKGVGETGTDEGRGEEV